MSASEASSLVGRRLGRFRILSRIGQGGLATVWRAHDELLGRDVALKVLNETVGDAVKDRKRFAHEAQAASALDHSGIVTVFDAGESDGLYYIALTLIDGDTLSDLARSRLLPIDEAVRVVVAAADALAHAHSRGVFHRDVSGRNVMVARDGRVFVLDFGLALMVGLSRVTTRETTLGTVAYMAPEAWQNKNLDGRADVYGLGVVLFEALTGTYPHEGDRTEQMAFAKLNIDPRAPSELRPDVPPALDWIVARALARDPDQRYAGMQDMLKDLRIYGRGGGVPVAEDRPALPARPIPRRGPDPRDETQTTLPDPMYLTVLPFSVDREASESEGLRSVASRLPRTIAAAMSSVRRVRIVHAQGISSSETDRAIAEHVGANLILRGELVRSGARVRITYALLDPQRGLQVGGGVVDGSEVQPFELEDAVIASVRSALGSDSAGLTSAIARPPDPAGEDKYRLAVRYLVRHDHQASLEGAIRLLEPLAEAPKPGCEHVATLGRACLAMHRLTKESSWESRAAQACERAVQLDADAPDVVLLVAEMDEQAGRIESAFAGFERVVGARPQAIEPRLGLVRLMVARQQWKLAEDAGVQITRGWPEDWRGFTLLGSVQFHRGRYDECLKSWQRVVALVPDSAFGHRNLGSALYHLDRFDEAIAAFERALEVQPSAIAFSNLGTVLFHLERYEEAVEMFERAVALRPTDAAAWGNLGNACRWIPGQQGRMRESLERAVALTRDLHAGHSLGPGTRAFLAGWLINLGCTREALAEIEAALEAAPEDVECMARAGYVHADANDHDAAIAWFREAVKRGYGTRELERSPVLTRLRQDPRFGRMLEEGRTSRPNDTGTTSSS